MTTKPAVCTWIIAKVLLKKLEGLRDIMRDIFGKKPFAFIELDVRSDGVVCIGETLPGCTIDAIAGIATPDWEQAYMYLAGMEHVAKLWRDVELRRRDDLGHMPGSEETP